jgi:hypothetical protein
MNFIKYLEEIRTQPPKEGRFGKDEPCKICGAPQHCGSHLSSNVWDTNTFFAVSGNLGFHAGLCPVCFQKYSNEIKDEIKFGRGIPCHTASELTDSYVYLSQPGTDDTCGSSVNFPYYKITDDHGNHVASVNKNGFLSDDPILTGLIYSLDFQPAIETVLWQVDEVLKSKVSSVQAHDCVWLDNRTLYIKNVNKTFSVKALGQPKYTHIYVWVDGYKDIWTKQPKYFIYFGHFENDVEVKVADDSDLVKIALSQGRTQKQLADLLGYNRQATISDILHGKQALSGPAKKFIKRIVVLTSNGREDEI